MKWRDHVKIAKHIAKVFKLPAEPLKEGAVSPDKFREKQVYITTKGKIYLKTKPHHIKNIGAIMRELKKARKFFFEGRIDKLSYHLGMALHHIQDACTGKGFLGFFHGSIENGISALNIPEDAVQAGLENFQPHPFKLRKALKKLKSNNNPSKVLWNATYYSFLAAKSVLEFGDEDSAEKEAEKLNGKIKKSLIVLIPANLTSLLAFLLTPSTEALMMLIVTIFLYLIPLHFNKKRKELKEWFHF